MPALESTPLPIKEHNDGGSTHGTATGTLQERFIGMFSYGSNNEQQLRARVKSPRLRGYPAFLDDYVRVFGYVSPPWGGGSVASVAPREGGRVYGCFYLMTPQEVEILDLYEHVKEGGYLKKAVMVTVRVTDGNRRVTDGSRGPGSSSSSNDENGGRNGGGGGGEGDERNLSNSDVSSSAITYIMSHRFVRTFVPPSPQYLTAVYRTLTSNFPELSDRPVEVRDHTGSKRSEWKYPGSRALPLEAFLLEVGLEEEPPWTFPYVLGPLVVRLKAAGMATTDALCDAAAGGVLLSKLAAAVHENIEAEASGSSNHVIGTNGGAEDGVAVEGGIGVPSTGNGPVMATESGKVLVRGTTVPTFTAQTVDIIVARIASKSGGMGSGEGSTTTAV